MPRMFTTLDIPSESVYCCNQRCSTERVGSKRFRMARMDFRAAQWAAGHPAVGVLRRGDHRTSERIKGATDETEFRQSARPSLRRIRETREVRRADEADVLGSGRALADACRRSDGGSVSANRYCVDCRHSITTNGGDSFKCAEPRNLDIVDKTPSSSCDHQRSYSWLPAIMLGKCGISGRWFSPGKQQ